MKVPKELKDFEEAMQDLMKIRVPLSKRTVENITHLGFSAINYYKHVAVIIEKFIKKCKPTHKICGLYVIDALVRYTIKQKGKEGDHLGPRFTRNFSETFERIMHCPSKDYPKVIRVLNLWQMKKIYSCDVIQPLLGIVTKFVESKDISRSPSMGEGGMGSGNGGSLDGPSTPPQNDEEDSYDEDADNGSYMSEIDGSFEQPRTPPLPDPNSYPLGPGKKSPSPKTKRPSPHKKKFQPLLEINTSLAVEEMTDEDKYTPTTSENVRKLGELLNVTSGETESKNNSTEKTNAAEFLQLLKTVNDEFSQELPFGSDTKLDRELRGEELRSDLESEVLGNESLTKECVNIPLEYKNTVDMSEFSPISDGQDINGSDMDIESANKKTEKLKSPENDVVEGAVKPEIEFSNEGKESKLVASNYAEDNENIKITVHQDAAALTTVTLENKEEEKTRKREKKMPKKEKTKISQRTPRDRKRNYREKKGSPVENLMPTGSDLGELSDYQQPELIKHGAKTKLSPEKPMLTKHIKRKKHKSNSFATNERSRSSSSASEKKKSKKSKKKKKKNKKHKKKAKNKHESSKKSDSSEENSDGSENDEHSKKIHRTPTKSLKEELDLISARKNKKRKKVDFDLENELTTDPIVNYGPHLYPKKCIIIYSTVLSISNITDLSFKRVNDLLKVYGNVLSVEMVVSLNKALVNYSERKSACCALVSLRHRNEFGISWAFPKPVSQPPWIEMWDGSVGCCVVPWNKAPKDPLVAFLDGCFIDKSTLPPPEELTKNNEVTSSTDPDRTLTYSQISEDESIGAPSNAEIKKKIAKMIAKSQKIGAANDEPPSPKKSKTESSVSNSSAFKPAPFAPVDRKAEATRFSAFGWGSAKKATSDSSAATTSTSTSSSNPLASTAETTAYNSANMYMNAHYQNYLQTAAMYQHMSYPPGYTYPYASYGAYNPYAYSGGYGMPTQNYQQMYGAAAASSSNSPYTAFVNSEASSQSVTGASPSKNAQTKTSFASTNQSSTSAVTSKVGYNPSKVPTCSSTTVPRSYSNFHVAPPVPSSNDSTPSSGMSSWTDSATKLNTLWNNTVTSSRSSVAANIANFTSHAATPYLTSNTATSTFSSNAATPRALPGIDGSSNSKDVDFRVQGYPLPQHKKIPPSAVTSISHGVAINPVVVSNYKNSTTVQREPTFVNQNSSSFGSSVTSSSPIVVSSTSSTSAQSVKYFFQSSVANQLQTPKGVSFSLASAAKNPTDVAINAVKAFLSSSNSDNSKDSVSSAQNGANSSLKQMLIPPVPPPFPPPPSFMPTSKGSRQPSKPPLTGTRCTYMSQYSLANQSDKSMTSAANSSVLLASSATTASNGAYATSTAPMSTQSNINSLMSSTSSTSFLNVSSAAVTVANNLSDKSASRRSEETCLLSKRSDISDPLRTLELSAPGTVSNDTAVNNQTAISPTSPKVSTDDFKESVSREIPIVPVPNPSEGSLEKTNDLDHGFQNSAHDISKFFMNSMRHSGPVTTNQVSANADKAPQSLPILTSTKDNNDCVGNNTTTSGENDDQQDVDMDEVQSQTISDDGTVTSEFANFLKSARECCQSVLDNCEEQRSMPSSVENELESEYLSSRQAPPLIRFLKSQTVPMFHERTFRPHCHDSQLVPRGPILNGPDRVGNRPGHEPVRIRIPIFRARNPDQNEEIMRPRGMMSDQGKMRFPPPRPELANTPPPTRAVPPRFMRVPAIRPNFRGPLPENIRRIQPLRFHGQTSFEPQPPIELSRDDVRQNTSNQLLRNLVVSAGVDRGPGVPFSSAQRMSFAPPTGGQNRPFRPHMADMPGVMLRNELKSRLTMESPEKGSGMLEKRAEMILRKEMQIALRAINPNNFEGGTSAATGAKGDLNEFTYSTNIKSRLGSIESKTLNPIRMNNGGGVVRLNLGDPGTGISLDISRGSVGSRIERSNSDGTSGNSPIKRNFAQSNLSPIRSSGFTKQMSGTQHQKGAIGIDLNIPFM